MLGIPTPKAAVERVRLVLVQRPLGEKSSVRVRTVEATQSAQYSIRAGSEALHYLDGGARASRAGLAV